MKTKIDLKKAADVMGLDLTKNLPNRIDWFSFTVN